MSAPFRQPTFKPGFAQQARDVRGSGVDEFAAPAGFAATVAGDILRRARSYHASYHKTWQAWTEPRVALLSELAVTIAGRGDRDPLIAGLAAYNGGDWSPGQRVQHLLDGVLTVPEPSAPGRAVEDGRRCEEATAKLPNAVQLLHRLSVATVGDVVEHARRIRDRAVSELSAVRPDVRIDALERRAATAEREAAAAAVEAKRAKGSESQLLKENGLLRSELRMMAELAGAVDPDEYVSAVAVGAGKSNGQENSELVESGAPGEPGTALPSGIRQRGKGRFEALLYRSETHDARQRSAGTYPSVEDALAAREAALARESASRLEAEAAAAQPGSDSEPDPPRPTVSLPAAEQVAA